MTDEVHWVYFEWRGEYAPCVVRTDEREFELTFELSAITAEPPSVVHCRVRKTRHTLVRAVDGLAVMTGRLLEFVDFRPHGKPVVAR